MKKAIILHGFWFHFEMLGSIYELFGNEYELDLYAKPFPQLFEWITIYSKLNLNVNYLNSISNTNYDLVILDTDDDKEMCELYNRYFFGIPVYVINHVNTGNRSNITKQFKFDIDIHGIQQEGKPFHFCGYNYLSVEEKVKNLSPIISVAIIGDVVNEEKDFLDLLKNRFTNFEDIDFYVINRTPPYWMTDRYSNIKYFINCNTILMFKILARCHYVYYFALKRGTQTCSACVGMAYANLCRLLCWETKKQQYEIVSPMFKSFEERFELKPISKEDLMSIEVEREILRNKTKLFMKKKLNCL